MVKIREAIVVEGRYDKNTLSQIVDAPILETSGFGIMKDKQQLMLQAFFERHLQYNKILDNIFYCFCIKEFFHQMLFQN
mgnify:CR=1 FL=1